MSAVGRIHYEIPDDLHRRAKSEAAIRGVTLKALVIEALERLLAERSRQARPRKR